MVLSARLAASAASFQPVNPAMSTGRSNCGRRSMFTYPFMQQAYHATRDRAKAENPEPERSYKARGDLFVDASRSALVPFATEWAREACRISFRPSRWPAQ